MSKFFGNATLLQTLLENTSEGIIAFNRQWEVVYINSAGAAMLDKDAESIQGKSIWIEFPASVGGKFFVAYHEAMRTQESRLL
ncbi:MAG TPA: PAS domain-containing protein, partial [Flavisolibacter sp.]|nr:PAS domain-containing protein [Flavisolibacter sp.]